MSENGVGCPCDALHTTSKESHKLIKLRQAKPSVLLHRNCQVSHDLRSRGEDSHARSQHLVQNPEVVLDVVTHVATSLVLAVHLSSCSDVSPNNGDEDAGLTPSQPM